MRQSRLGSGCAGWLPFLLLGWLHWDGVWAEQSAGLCRVVVCLQPLGSVGVDQTEEYMVWSRFGPFRIKKICEETVSRSDLDKKNFRLWPKKSSLDPRLYSNCTIARFSQWSSSRCRVQKRKRARNTDYGSIWLKSDICRVWPNFLINFFKLFSYADFSFKSIYGPTKLFTDSWSMWFSTGQSPDFHYSLSIGLWLTGTFYLQSRLNGLSTRLNIGH